MQIDIESQVTCLAPDEFIDLVYGQIIPKLLAVIEDSGINARDAERIPSCLEQSISTNNMRAHGNTPFKVLPPPWEECGQ